MKTVLTIAGSDCSGGAGIQADLKTMTALGVYGMSAVTALTAQNTMGVFDILESSSEFLEKQLNSIFEDILPDAVKIGMVSDCRLIGVIADRLSIYQAGNVVLDPVMVSTSGSRLLKEDAIEVLADRLIPMAALITPNIPEAEILSGGKIKTETDMEKAAKIISEKYSSAVLIKGGHQVQDANDILYEKGEIHWFYGERIHNSNTHGTGCTLSSAIACGLAEGFSMKDSIRRAKRYLSAALGTDLNLGKGSGPLNHCVKAEFP